MVRAGGSQTTACIDENAALDFVQGRLAGPEVQRIDEHVDGCPTCRVLLEEAVRAFRERVTDGHASGPAPLTRFAPGDTLSGRYRIVRFIARGGMGEVYEAEDMILGARVALKTLAATISDDPLAIRRMKLEVSLARRITHPNVCRIFDLGVQEQTGQRAEDGVLFLTMELIPGTSLGQRLRAEGRFSQEAALPIVQAMAAALAAAHDAGIVHRDFKSDNVMLAPGDAGGPPRVVVMDFGLARATSLPTNTSSFDRSLAGTLAYMAPEQLEGKATGPATDIYALGIVTFEVLTGQLPFEGESPLGGAWKRMKERAPSPRRVVPELDVRWVALVARCLEREARRRPASAGEVQKALAAIGADAIGITGRRAAVVVAAAALGLAAMGVGAVMHRRERRRPVAAIRTVAMTSPARVAAPAPLPPASIERAAVLAPPAPPAAIVRHAPRAHPVVQVVPPQPAAPDPDVAPAPASQPAAASEVTARRRSADPDDGFIFR